MPRKSEALADQRRYRWQVLLDADPSYALLQHIGNLEIARLFNAARVEFNRHIVAQMSGVEHFSKQLIVHIGIDFLREVPWSPELRVDVRVSRIGGTSYALELAVFAQDTLASRCITTSVWMENGRPATLNHEARRLLSTFA